MAGELKESRRKKTQTESERIAEHREKSFEDLFNESFARTHRDAKKTVRDLQGAGEAIKDRMIKKIDELDPTEMMAEYKAAMAKGKSPTSIEDYVNKWMNAQVREIVGQKNAIASEVAAELMAAKRKATEEADLFAGAMDKGEWSSAKPAKKKAA